MAAIRRKIATEGEREGTGHLNVRVVGTELVGQLPASEEMLRGRNFSPEYTPAADYGGGSWARANLQRKSTTQDEKGARGQIEAKGGDGRARGHRRRPEFANLAGSSGGSGEGLRQPWGGIGVAVLGK